MHVQTKVILNLPQLEIKSMGSEPILPGYKFRPLHILAMGSSTTVSSTLICEVGTTVELDPYGCVCIKYHLILNENQGEMIINAIFTYSYTHTRHVYRFRKAPGIW